MRKVYLAGAIAGLNDRGATWRDEATNILAGARWAILNPLLFETAKLTPQQLVDLDYTIISSCDLVLVNAGVPSWGTAMEIAYAKAHGIPVVAFDVPEGVSKWLLAHVDHTYPNLNSACLALFREL